MKNLFALFSAKKVNNALSALNADVLQKEELRKIRGGGEPIIQENNIIIKD